MGKSSIRGENHSSSFAAALSRFDDIDTTEPQIFRFIADKIRSQYKEDREQFKDAVTQFLKYGTAQADTISLDRRCGDKQDNGEDKVMNQMDHCLRLALPRGALRKGFDGRKDIAQMLCKTIVEHWPVLAFMRKYNTGKGCWLQEQCSHKSQHALYPDTSIPFHLAVSKGDHELVKLMLDRIRVVLDQKVLLQRPMEDSDIHLGQDIKKDLENNPDQLRYLEGRKIKLDDLNLLSVVKGYAQNESICRLALENSEDFETSEAAKLKTLEELLTVTGIAISSDQGAPDEAFDIALRKNLDTAVKAFLKREVPVSTSCLKSALENYETSKQLPGSTAGQSSKASDAGLNILEYLVAKATKGVLDHEIIRYIIRGNLTSVWNVVNKNILDNTTKVCLLATAVLYGSLKFIKLFVEEDPQALGVAVKLPADDGVPGVNGVSDGDDRFPLWYNNHRRERSTGNELKFVLRKSKPDKVRGDIRDFLVDKMTRELPIDKLSDILHRSHVNELCFDISSFSSDNYSASDFIDSIFFQEEQGGQDIIRFEKTLKYVAFPQFDVKPAGREMYQDNANLRKPHREVFEVLRWLEKKRVDKIIELIVPDRLINPHDDVEMAWWLKAFGVEKLDWRVLDLSFTNLRDPPMKNPSGVSKKEFQNSEIRELHIYSSGKQSVLDHWLSPQGIESLKNLKKLRIHVVRETCTRTQVQRALSSIQRGITAIRNRRVSDDKKKHLIMTVPNETPWYSTPAVADLTRCKSLPSYTTLSDVLTQYLSPRLAKLVQDLSGKVYEGIRSGQFKRTKVAILDNGILCVPPVLQASQSLPSVIEDGLNENETTSEKVKSTQSPQSTREAPLSSNPKQKTNGDKQGLWYRIRGGKSFVESSSRFNPWQFPSDAHGTQMANLICALDPYCDLYVARVAETTVGINAASVAKAIDWAVDDCKVDVISMSFVVDSDPDKKLQNAVMKATENEVVTLCSTHDEGSKVHKAWPASLLTQAKEDCGNLIVLAACDEFGQLLRDADPNSYTYQIAGKDVQAGVVPFVKSTETISGSSVATVLAAGIASLTITGDGLANPGRSYYANKSEAKNNPQTRALKPRLQTVKDHLNEMKAAVSDKHVLLEKFCKVGNTGVGKGHLYNDPYMPNVE
ncbi:unnamed protein product, partial [Clonostachys rhizophaga]